MREAHKRGKWFQRAKATHLGAERKLKPEGVKLTSRYRMFAAIVVKTATRLFA
jgi:hypothetical protein